MTVLKQKTSKQGGTSRVLELFPSIQVKYGTRASSGGGRASARETIGRVAAGAVAEKPPGGSTGHRALRLWAFVFFCISGVSWGWKKEGLGEVMWR